MANDSMRYVAIIGEFWELKEPAETAEAKKMAKQIGTALAKAEMGLVVYNSDDKSLEPHVVSGYVEALPAGTGTKSIRVRFAKSQKDQVKFAEEATRREVFDPIVFGSDDWEAPFYRSLAAADGVDAVLLMSGARSTLIAGRIALARLLPVLAIDKFDGSAGIIRNELALADNDYPSSTTQSTAELVTWLKAKSQARAEQLAKARDLERKYLKVTSQRKKTCWTEEVPSLCF